MKRVGFIYLSTKQNFYSPAWGLHNNHFCVAACEKKKYFISRADMPAQLFILFYEIWVKAHFEVHEL